MWTRVRYFRERTSLVRIEGKQFFSTKRSFTNFEEIVRTGQLPVRFNFARDVFDRHVAKNPSNFALWMESDHKRRRWTFAELHKESIRASILLKDVLSETQTSPLDNGLNPPIILAILPRVPEWWFLHLASIRIGAVFSPATTQLTSQDIEYRLAASGAQIVITDARNMWKVEEAQRRRRGKFPYLRKIVVGNGINADGWIQYNDLVENILDVEILKFRNFDTKSDSLAQIFFTSGSGSGSGTTGKPKMVAHSHSSYGVGQCITSHILQLGKNDVMWNISDPGCAKSSYSNFFAPWSAGSTVYINQMERFEPRKVLNVLCNQEITTLCAPPTSYRLMLQETASSLFKFKSLRSCYCYGAGEAVSPDISKEWKIKSGHRIHEFYGQMETAAMGSPPSQTQKEGSIGKVVGFDVRIVDDDGQELQRNVDGNIAVKVKPDRPAALFLGYLKPGTEGLEIDNSAGCYVGDYYMTGDRGYVDEDGHLFRVGRSEDVIISAGYRISPYEVESALLNHEAVVESAVVAYPDQESGSVVKAFIVLSDQYKGKDETELIENIQEHVKIQIQTDPSKYPQYPHQIQFVDALPKSLSGETLRRELRRVQEAVRQAV